MHIAEHCETVGRLMSPLEVYAATLSRADISNQIKHEWFLCGDIPEKMWDVLVGGQVDVGFRLSAFTTPCNTGYCCFTIQVEESQARFLLPLGSEKVAWFLKDASLCGLHMSIARNNSSTTILRKFGVAPSAVAPVLDIAKRCRDLTGQDLINDFGHAFNEISRTSMIASVFNGVTVKEAHVVIVPPQ